MKIATCKHCRLAFEQTHGNDKYCGECNPKRTKITIYKKNGYLSTKNYDKE